MRVQVINEIKTTDLEKDGDASTNPRWVLCFQQCRYVYDDGGMQPGYRFIWRTPEGNLQPARGQARLPSVALAKQLMDRAIEDGWGSEDY